MGRQTMRSFFSRFNHAETGAVTVDWVVLSAAVIGIAVAAVTGMRNGTVGLADNVSSYMASQ